MLASDYVGSEACRECHLTEYNAFIGSPMHRMTRALGKTEIQAPFAGERFELRGDAATLTTDHEKRRLELRTRDGKQTNFRVTKVIGGRYREDFVGIEESVTGGEQRRIEEKILPVSYLIFDKTYRYKGYSVLVTERTALEPGQVWRETCIFCHNTPPQFTTLFDELHGPGFPSYQGSASDDAPEDRRFRYQITDRAELANALRSELSRIGERASPGDDTLLSEAILRTRRTFDERHLVELGIGCEACHGGSREHAARPRAIKPSFRLESTFFRVTAADGSQPSPALEINRTCAKCHTVLFSRYPYTWEGGHRHRDPGGSPINSGEARDFLLGACRSQLSCVRCHDPHREDPRERLDALAGPSGDAICTSCHLELSDPARSRAHSHHPPESSGSHCLACHMPKKNLGLAYQLSRYHRIGSPTDRERVEGDRPLECALCHTDQSVDQIVRTMERFWGKHYDRERLKQLYGADLSINPLRAALLAGLPHEKAVAAVVAAEHDRKELLPLIVDAFENEYPLVRYFAKHAAERLSGRAIPIDPAAPALEIRSAAARWLNDDNSRN